MVGVLEAKVTNVDLHIAVAFIVSKLRTEEIQLAPLSFLASWLSHKLDGGKVEPVVSSSVHVIALM